MRSMNELPLTISGDVIQGFGQARATGFPTANLVVSPLDAPSTEGTYFGKATISGEDRTYDSVIFFGIPYTQPSVTEPRLEVYLLENVRDLYGVTLNVTLQKFIRPNQKFDTTQQLGTAIADDFAKAHIYFSS